MWGLYQSQDAPKNNSSSTKPEEPIVREQCVTSPRAIELSNAMNHSEFHNMASTSITSEEFNETTTTKLYITLETVRPSPKINIRSTTSNFKVKGKSGI